MLLVSGSTKSVARLVGRYRNQLGHLLTPANRNGMAATLKSGLWWAADNGAFNGFDAERFRVFLRKIAGQPRCLFVVCPDKVSNARTTASLYQEWHAEVSASGQPVAFVLQDGQEDLPLPDADAYFIGGSTTWKLSASATDLADEVKRQGKHLHMGRVNSRRRMEHAQDMGCDSIDGSSASMFGDRYIHKYLLWLNQLDRQPSLFR